MTLDEILSKNLVVTTEDVKTFADEYLRLAMENNPGLGYQAPETLPLEAQIFIGIANGQWLVIPGDVSLASASWASTLVDLEALYAHPDTPEYFADALAKVIAYVKTIKSKKVVGADGQVE